MGTPDHPCDLHSKWRKISFVGNDEEWGESEEVFLQVTGTGPFKLEFNQWLRTVVHNFTVDHDDYTNYSFDPEFRYFLCGTPQEKINGKLYIRLEDNKCVKVQNPAVNLNGYESSVSTIFNFPNDHDYNSLHVHDHYLLVLE